MRKISIVDKDLVDAGGWRVRLDADVRALGIDPQGRHFPPKGFVDLGLVEFEGREVYLSMYKPPVKRRNENG